MSLLFVYFYQTTQSGFQDMISHTSPTLLLSFLSVGQLQPQNCVLYVARLPMPSQTLLKLGSPLCFSLPIQILSILEGQLVFTFC